MCLVPNVTTMVKVSRVKKPSKTHSSEMKICGQKNMITSGLLLPKIPKNIKVTGVLLALFHLEENDQYKYK